MLSGREKKKTRLRDPPPPSNDPGSDSLHHTRLLLFQQPEHSSLPTASSVVKPGPPSLRLSPVARALASSYASSRVHSSSQNCYAFSRSASILRDCTFECVDHRQLSARADRGRPSHPI